MKKKIEQAMDRVSDSYIAEAAASKKKKRYPFYISAIAAVLAVVIAAGIFLRPMEEPITMREGSTTPTGAPLPVPGTPTPPSYQVTSLKSAPSYPEMVQHPADDTDYQEYEQWRNSFNAQHGQPEGYADSLTDFFKRSIPEFLSGEGNQAYSPINLYMALAMVAETAQGESRRQLLDLLGADSIEALRTQAGHVWNAHYNADGRTTSLLANSLWLDEAYGFNADTAKTLSDSYYAAVYHGDLGTAEMNAALQDWLNTQTGGLLEKQAQNVELSPSTIFALASAICFSADWEPEFSERKTYDQVFHAPSEDVTVPFLHQTKHRTYYRGEGFGAVQLQLSGENSMWLILPDENRTPRDILQSGEYLELLQDPYSWDGKKTLDINLSLPKFDISSQNDLVDGMKRLGVTDIFSTEKADLSGLVDMSSVNGNAYVDSINHAVRVAIDEEGVTAAAFTVVIITATGAPAPSEQMDFTLDRPFVFVVTGGDDLPLFAGIVENP